MRRTLLLFAGLASLVATAADPYVGYIYPAGIRVGATNRVIVGGQFLMGARNAFVSGPGVRVVSVEAVPNFPPPTGGTQRQYLQNWLKAIGKGRREKPPYPENARLDEWRSNVWWNVLGELDDQKLAIVARDLYTKRNALQMSPSLRQRLLVTVVADADATPGVREFRVSAPNGISAPRPFEVTTASRLEEPLFTVPSLPQPPVPTVTSFPTVLDGEIMPGETDSWRFPLRKGVAVTFCVRGREFQPYIGDAVPGFFNPVLRILDPSGREIAFADDYFYHPDPVMTFTPPADGTYVLEIRDAIYRGREDFVYAIAVAEGAERPDVREVPIWPIPDQAVPAASMVKEFRGTVSEPGKVVCHELDLAGPDNLVIDVLARRAGSPLDPRVEVSDVNGRVLAVLSDMTNTLHCGSIIQGECDPIGSVFFDGPGRYTLRVCDEEGKGGSDWSYVLRVHRPAPRFEVWMSPSALSLRPGERRPAKVAVVRRDGFAGPIRLRETDLLRFEPAVIPATSAVMRVSVVSKADRMVPVQSVELFAAAERAKRPFSQAVRIRPADEYNQAFAWDHLLPAGSFVFRGAPGQGPKGRKPNRRGKKPKTPQFSPTR